MDDYVHLFKLVLIGDATTGKTALLERYFSETFLDKYLATIGVDFKLKKINIDGKSIKIQLWDTAGEERLRLPTGRFYRGANGFIITYDCTNEKSFYNLLDWVQEIENNTNDNVCKVIVATKCDLDHKAIAIEKAEALGRELRLRVFETSSKDGTNVNETIEYLVRQILEKQPEILETRRVILKPVGPSESDINGCC
jgi:small GTP-binding protein